MKRIFALAAAFAAAVVPALAADSLNTETVRHFVETLAPVQAFGDSLEKEGKLNVLVGGGATVDGAFEPYSAGVTALKAQLPADFNRLEAVVKPHGFTPELWGATGDRVMAAYMALRIERDEPGALAALEPVDPAEMQKMPPEMRKQMQDYAAMMEAVKKAPDDDKKAVLPAMDAIDAHINAQGDPAAASASKPSD
jgi:hypothetical protein